MSVLGVVLPLLSRGGPFYLPALALGRPFLLVVSVIPEQVKPLAIVSLWAFDLEVRVEKENVENCQLCGVSSAVRGRKAE